MRNPTGVRERGNEAVMAELLTHAAALACSILALCCAASGPTRQRRERGAASLLMTAAMLDIAVLHLVPPIAWAGGLLAAALVLSVLRRVRAGRDGDGVYAFAGLVVMAALLASAAHGASPSSSSATISHHGVTTGPPPLLWLCVALGLGHVVASAYRARRGARADRVHHAAMGCATALMTLVALL